MSGAASERRISFVLMLTKLLQHLIPRPTSLALSYQVQPFQPGDMDCLGGVYAVLNAFHLATAHQGGLSEEEAWKAFRFAVKHLADRRTGLDTYSMGMTMKRAQGLARQIARLLSDWHRQFYIETPPTHLNSSIDQLLQWVEHSSGQGLPVVALLDDSRRRFVVVTGIDRTKLHLFGGDQQSIQRMDCAVRRGLAVLSATETFRVRVDQPKTEDQHDSRMTALEHKVAAHQ
jgi:hypothetical protein